ncbi:MAG: S49 family peptidase [Phycisphaerales bacterium]
MRDPVVMQYAREPWMMEPCAARLFFSSLAELRVGDNLSAVQIDAPLSIRVESDKAVIPVTGVLLKTVPAVLKIVYGSRITGYDEIRAMLGQAVANPAVKRIEMQITSPGGQVAGGMETAAAIRAADAIKPVTAVIEDLGASGAFWLATSARRIEANANAEVGSIGVYTYYTDWSGLEDKWGIRTVVIRSGEHKGMGLDKITDSQIAAVQEVIDGMNSHFIDQVAAGRKVSREQAAEWATGRVWLAPAAVQMGLIDAITEIQTLQLPVQAKENSMSEQSKVETASAAQVEAAAAAVKAEERRRVGDLKAAFPKDPAFAMEAIEAGWTVMEAKAERHDRLEKEAAETPKGDKGIEYHDSDASGGDVDFIAESKRISRDEKISMTEAMRRVQAEQPESYSRFLASEQQRPVRNRSGKAAAGRVTV